ncbi:MAG: lipopolysaccharide kinase InaA family protein [Planctomycetaceae bacterium]
MNFSVALGDVRPQIAPVAAGSVAGELARRLRGMRWQPLPAATPTGTDDGLATGCAGRGWSVRDLIDHLGHSPDREVVRVVKRGPHRTVYRVAGPEGGVYVKHFHPQGWFNWLKHWVRATRAEHEAAVARELTQRGLPVPKVLAWGCCRRLGSPCESVLITREVPGGVALEELPRLLRGLSSRERAEARHRVAMGVGELVGRLHRAGARHRDLHAGNVLVSRLASGDCQLTLIDLQAVHLGPVPTEGKWVSPPAALHLALTGQTSATDRLRFWRAFQTAARATGRAAVVPTIADGAEGAGSLTGRVAARAEQRRALQREADRLAGATLRGWDRADRAFARGNRHVRRVIAGGHTLRGLATLPESWLREVAGNPEALFDPGRRRATFKQTHRCRVVLAWVPELPGSGEVCVKGVVPGRAVARWLQRVRWSPVRRAWELGHALLRRGIATPKPLACVDSTTGLGGVGYLVTEALPGTQTGRELVAAHAGMPGGARELWPWGRRLAKQLSRLHACHFDHRDLKLANVLVAGGGDRPGEAGGPGGELRRAEGFARVWLLDLDGIRRWRRLPRARRVQNLARLHVSLAAQGVDSTWLRVRFLQVYLAGSGEDWRDWWNWVARAARRKRDQNARRGRPIS